MAEIKKEQDALFSTIYKMATDLVHAGHVAEWDFKSYVFVTMFYRYISENLTNYINAGERAAGDKDFDYAKMSDAEAEGARDGLIQEKGFFILPSELFCNVLKNARQNENLNETVEGVFRHIAIIDRCAIAEITCRSSLVRRTGAIHSNGIACAGIPFNCICFHSPVGINRLVFCVR